MQHPFEHDITALAYDMVEGSERETLLAHLAECDACRALYDSYRDEQVAVREAIVRDARSGAAEAAALERTLRMLGGEQAARPARGRLFPLWLIAGELAAMLVVGLGLFFILKPGDETPDDVIRVSEADRAPAEVESGVAYLQDSTGEWREADAVPVDQWVRTGPETFSIRLSTGSRAEMQPDSVFRISLESAEGEPVVYMLRGDGVIDTSGVAYDTLVRSGNTAFYAMPDAKLALNCESNAGVLRSWSAADSVRAQVLDGDVVLWSDSEPVSHLPLKAGESVEWSPQRRRIVSGDNAVLLEVAPGRQQTVEVEDEWFKQLEVFLPRLQAYEKRISDGQGPRHARVRSERLELERTLFEINAQSSQQLIVIENDLSVVLSTDGETLTLKVSDRTGSSVHTKKSVDDLKAAVPQRVAEIIDGFDIQRDQAGKFRLDGVEAAKQGSSFMRIRKTGGE